MIHYINIIIGSVNEHASHRMIRHCTSSNELDQLTRMAKLNLQRLKVSCFMHFMLFVLLWYYFELISRYKICLIGQIQLNNLKLQLKIQISDNNIDLDINK